EAREQALFAFSRCACGPPHLRAEHGARGAHLEAVHARLDLDRVLDLEEAAGVFLLDDLADLDAAERARRDALGDVLVEEVRLERGDEELPLVRRARRTSRSRDELDGALDVAPVAEALAAVVVGEARRAEPLERSLEIVVPLERDLAN